MRPSEGHFPDDAVREAGGPDLEADRLVPTLVVPGAKPAVSPAFISRTWQGGETGETGARS